MCNLILVRGLPGAGKTTIAKLFDGCTMCADEYFDVYLKGKFIAEELPMAHHWCRNRAEYHMEIESPTIVVHNTFTEGREMQPYFELARKYGYKVHTIIVENRHGNKSVHNVPEKTMERMEKRFTVSLR